MNWPDEHWPKGMTIEGAFLLLGPMPGDSRGSAKLFCFQRCSDPIWMAEQQLWGFQFKYVRGKWVPIPEESHFPLSITVGVNDVPAWKHQKALPIEVKRRVFRFLLEEYESFAKIYAMHSQE